MTREEAIKLIEHVSIVFMPTDQYGDYDDPQPYEEAFDMAIEALKAEPIRCKECKHYIVEGITTQYGWCHEYKHSVDEDDYCSYGERKK